MIKPSTIKSTRHYIMSVFTLTLVRHGETSANKNGIIQGQTNVPLSEDGLRQAQLVGYRLQNETFSHIYVSDLDRAQQTAKAIIDCNRMTKCPLVQDPRLRERHFGIYQGMPVREFRDAAKKRGAAPLEFKPEEGETLDQLRQRCVQFFQDLCQRIRQLKLQEDSNGSNHSNPKRPVSYSGSLCYGCSPEGVFSMDLSNKESADSNKNQVGDKGAEGVSEVADRLSPMEEIESEEGQAEWSPKKDSKPMMMDLPSSESHDSNSFESSPSEPSQSLPGGTTFSPPLDADMKNLVSSANVHVGLGCPNVSLSPLVEQRFTRLSSSISSGRNSFDESELLPPVIADVLLVSHGGVIREFLRYFMNELGCQMPGGKNMAMKVSPNTGVSRFIISIPDGHERPKVTSIFIHDNAHLAKDAGELPQTYGLS